MGRGGGEMAALPYSSRLTGGDAGGHCLQELKANKFTARVCFKGIREEGFCERV